MADRKVIDLSVADSTDIQSSNAILYLVNPDRVLDSDKDRKLGLKSNVVLTSLNQTIGGDKTFTGDNSFSGTLTFSGNATFSNTITGSISGNAGTVTDGVYTSRQINTGTGLSGGGDLSADRTIGIASGFGLIPSGGIIMWSGSVASIPSGWFLCDGNNGTPDLRDRFVVGAGDNYDPDDEGNTGSAVGLVNNKTNTSGGGSAHNHTITINSGGSHTHSGTTGATAQGTTVSVNSHTLTEAQIPSHRHSYKVGYDFGGTNWGTRNTEYTGGGQGHTHGTSVTNPTHTHSFSISSSGSHSHTGSSANESSHTHSVTFDVRPPFYALAFIMKA